MRSTISATDIPKTQAEEVLYHLLYIGRLSSYGAIREYGITRLAARVWELKNEGWDIHSSTASSTNRHGKKLSYSIYYLIKTNDGTTTSLVRESEQSASDNGNTKQSDT